jgi:HIRAN domain
MCHALPNHVMASPRVMNDDIIVQWLQQLSPLSALVAGFVPAVIARLQGRPVIRWYLYGFVCALVAWPLVALPTAHLLLVRPRPVSPELLRKQRRAQAMALFAEGSVQSYPSWIAGLRRKSPAGVDRRRYAYEHLAPGEALELVPEPANQPDDHAVIYYHRGMQLGYVPKRHRWVAEAIDDGHRLVAIVDKVKTGVFLRRRAKFVSTRIAILDK